MIEGIEDKWWFGFRQTQGRVIACGPYEQYEKANLEREKAKAPDCSVSSLFVAKTKADAEEKAKNMTP